MSPFLGSFLAPEVRAARLLRRVQQPRRPLPDPAAQGRRARRVGREGCRRQGRRPRAAPGLVPVRPGSGSVAGLDDHELALADPDPGTRPGARLRPRALDARRASRRRPSSMVIVARLARSTDAPRRRDAAIDEDRTLPAEVDAPGQLAADPRPVVVGQEHVVVLRQEADGRRDVRSATRSAVLDVEQLAAGLVAEGPQRRPDAIDDLAQRRSATTRSACRRRSPVRTRAR